MQAVASLFNWSRLSRLLPWLGAALLIAGLVVFLVNRGNQINAQDKANDAAAAKSYVAPPKNKTTRLEPAAREVAGKFILDAVQRKNLAEAWTLVGPEFTQGMTKKEWMTGNIPVIPFPYKLGSAPLKVDISHPRYALLEVALLPKNQKLRAQGGYYFLEMRKFGAKWRVTSWVPRLGVKIPTNPAGS
jgi:hypothetical protein